MTRWISCRTGAMKSPRRSTESLAAGARNVLATYDRLEGGQANGSVGGVPGGRYVHALVSGRAPALVQRVVLAAGQTSLGHRRIAARAGTVRNIASARTRARPRLRNGHERRVPR